MSQNLSLRAAGLRVIEARAARGITVGRFFPQTQQVVGSAAAHQVSANDAFNGGDRSYSTASVGIEAAWELDFWGKFRRDIESADATVQVTVADFDAVMVSLAADVATDYILIRSLEERLVYAQANVALQLETLKLTEARFRGGAVSELDVATAQATLANTRALIPDLENSLRQSRLALCILLGRTPSDLDTELAPAAGAERRVPEAPAQIAMGVPAELLRRRPDVFGGAGRGRSGARRSVWRRPTCTRAFRSREPPALPGARSSRRALRPNLSNTFDASSFFGVHRAAGELAGAELWTDRGEHPRAGWLAGMSKRVAAYQDTVLRAAGDVEGGLSDFLRSKDRTVQLVEAVAASQRSADLSLIQYRAGAVDFIRVNTAQTALVQQQDSLVSSKASIALGAVRTYRALGGGWEARSGQEFVDKETVDRMRQRTDWGDVLAPDWHNGKDLGFTRPPIDEDMPTANK